MVVQSPPIPPVEPRKAGAPDAGVIEEARARQRRQRHAAGAAVAAAAGIAAVLLVIAGGGGSARGVGNSATPGQTPVSGKRSGLSNAACVWHPTISGSPSKALLSILGVLRRPATPADTDSALLRGLGGPQLGSEVYANYIRLAREFDGGRTYLFVVRDTGCGRFARGQAGDRVWVARPSVRELGGCICGASAIEDGQWFSLGGPGIKGLATTSETVTLLVPDDVTSVSIRYPTEAVEPAYHRHPGPIVPALTINAKPVNNLVMFNV